MTIVPGIETGRLDVRQGFWCREGHSSAGTPAPLPACFPPAPGIHAPNKNNPF